MHFPFLNIVLLNHIQQHKIKANDVIFVLEVVIARALQKKMRGRPRVANTAEHARLYQYLMRQGFTPAGITAALRKLGGRRDSGTD